MTHYSGSIIDAHHHLWRFEPESYPWLEADGNADLARNVLPADYLATFNRFDIETTVLVEALAADPQRELHHANHWHEATQGRIAGAVVAHVPLDAADIEARLDAFLQICPQVRGIRDIVASRPGKPTFARKPDLLDDPRFARGLKALADRKLTFDLLIDPTQLDAAWALLSDIPDLGVAIEHAGNPCERSASGMKQWLDGMRRFAERPATIVKVSALQVHDPKWTLDSLNTVFEPLLALFGPQRLCMGSDYPVHDRFCPGPVAMDVFVELTANWSPSDQRAFFRETALSFYSIAEPCSKKLPTEDIEV